MVAWPWEEATNPAPIFHAADPKHVEPRAMCRKRALCQVKD